MFKSLKSRFFRILSILKIYRGKPSGTGICRPTFGSTMVKVLKGDPACSEVSNLLEIGLKFRENRENDSEIVAFLPCTQELHGFVHLK